MKRPFAALLACGLAAALVPVAPASATPVATNEQERELYGRVFLEPDRSVDFIQMTSEFRPALALLAKTYPKYMQATTIAKALHQPDAVSVGPDGYPAWDKRDTGDGYQFDVATVTDLSVPDRNKGYVLLTNAHSAEPCGREAVPRFLEDLLIWRTTDPGHVLTDGTGITGVTHKITVRDLLRRVKIIYVNVAPDGWAAGDKPSPEYSQYNGAGINNNRVAYQDGWVYPPNSKLYRNGYSTLTQPEGAAVTAYLEKVRRTELHGRPFAAFADMHGPLPAGAVLLHDQGNTPAKIERVHDLAARVVQAMDGALGSYITPQGASAYEQTMAQADQVHMDALRAYMRYVGPEDEKAAFITTKWAEYAPIWDHLDYTVSGSYGGWAGSHSGLDADAISYEIDCTAYAPYDPARMQVFVDNIRAIIETTAVHAAFRFAEKPVQRSLKGTVGFYEPGTRVTDADGNPSPPPPGFPGNPIVGTIHQRPYNVENTDEFRGLRQIISTPIDEVRPENVDTALGRLDSFVVDDTTVGDAGSLGRFVRGGGNLVLTDSALRLLPSLVKGITASDVREGFAYVGYSDLDRSRPFTHGLYARARQMYDPVGLGYPLLMERDQYWPCDQTSCVKSPTQNSSPIWTVERAAWEKAGGVTIGTADPPKDRHGREEGQATDKTNIGILELGKGRIVIFGALLPQPTERYPHWFGLDATTISLAGQELLLRALTWQR